ncbi:ATP synthase subunit f, mitochondrial isoform X2 [Mustela putorius furo]|uniref:ATP synthase subunit f, mitochondrial isoform X2 n=1 Tax=Mustela putorius furo TaxID=9669 RepID=A0A8U0RUQ8_MUSPF|nr:ATP synthase subunit f, mitochondrial isoform X2 [Mustela putorius furo]
MPASREQIPAVLGWEPAPGQALAPAAAASGSPRLLPGSLRPRQPQRSSCGREKERWVESSRRISWILSSSAWKCFRASCTLFKVQFSFRALVDPGRRLEDRKSFKCVPLQTLLIRLQKPRDQGKRAMKYP